MTRFRASSASGGQADGLVSCVIGGAQYALRGGHVREIVRAERMRRCIRPDGAVGMVTIGGETIPVYSPAAILDGHAGAAGASQPGGNHIIVTHSPHGAAGWLVDRVARSRLPDGVGVTPLPPMVGTPATRWFEGLLRIDDRSLLLLSPEHLDPRAPSPPDGDDWVPAPFPSASKTGPSRVAEQMVITFSSPALPRCGAERYAVSARRIVAVVESLPICVVPGSAPHVIGVAVWRGEVMPVMDFRDPVNRVAIERSRLLVVRGGGHSPLVAFPVEPEMALHQATRDDCEADAALEETPPFVAGTFIVGGSRLALIHVDALLASCSQTPSAPG